MKEQAALRSNGVTFRCRLLAVVDEMLKEQRLLFSLRLCVFALKNAMFE